MDVYSIDAITCLNSLQAHFKSLVIESAETSLINGYTELN